MKNIKKSLALVLAFVMILGLCTIGAGAASTDFKDAASINPKYASAVKVMAGMGILAGSDDNGDGVFDFNPKANVTRAQAAKIVAYLILGKETAEKLPAKAVLDIKATDWQAKYVYYLYSKGIVNGYGNNSFGSNDSVTPNQFAKMLLSGCKYGQAGEFTGAGWDVNVFVVSTENDVYEDCDITDYDAAATREEAAMMAYNVLTKVKLVSSYNKDDGYGYSDDTLADTKYNFKEATGIIQGCQATGETYTVYLDNKTSESLNLNVSVDKTLVGHEVTIYYNTDKKTDSDKKTYYNVYLVEDVSTLVTPGFKTNSAVYKLLGGSKLNFSDKTVSNYAYASNYKYWVNYKLSPTTPTNLKDIDWKAKNDTLGNDYAYMVTYDFTFAGSYILNEDKKIIGYTVTSYYVDKVSKIVTTAGSEEIQLANGLDADLILSNNSTKDEVVEYDGIAKGDIVSVSYDGSIYTLTKATVVNSVTVTKIDANNVINGTYRATSSNKLTSKGDAIAFGNTYDLYLDKNKNYCYAEKVASGATNLALVTYLYKNTSKDTYGDTTTKLYAQCVDEKGVEHNYLVTPAQYIALGGIITNVNDLTTAVNAQKTLLTTVYEAADSSGTYGTSAKVGVFTIKKDTADSQLFNSYTTRIGSGSNYLDSSVTYIYVDKYLADLDVTVSSSKPSGTYNIYFSGEKVTNTSNYTVSVVFIASPAPETAGTSYIYSYANDNRTYSYKYCKWVGQTASDEFWISAYLDGSYSEVFKYKSLSDPTLFAVTSMGTTNYYLYAGFYSYKIDSEGYYTLTPITDAKNGTNAVIEYKKITSLFNGKLTAAPTIGIDVDISSAKIVDFTGKGISDLSALTDAVSDYDVYISFVAEDYYNASYNGGTGNPNATVGTIYINDVIAKAS